MKYALLALSLLVVGCSGGGGSSPTPAIVAVAAPVASASPAVAQNTPSPAPLATATASPIPTATPTSVPASLKRIGGAPLTATASQLSRIRTQSVTLAQGTTNGLPILVESSGMVAAWAGDFGIWTTNVATSQDIPQTGLTVTPSGNLPINNPGPQPLSCLGQASALCAVHPTSWTFGTTSANGKPVGRQTLTVAFTDGTSGTTFDYVYDGWSLPCNAGWAYIGGVPVAQATRATSDVYADCVAGNIVFPKGGYVLANPQQDQYGNFATLFPTFVAAPIFISDIVNVSMASISQGIVFAIQTQDGGSAKVYFLGSSSTTTTSSVGMSLHSNGSGAFDF